MTEERWSTLWLILIIFAWALIWYLIATVVHAQEHTGHRPQDIPIHERFYSTWTMPDNRAISCCSNQDCRPAASKQINGKWYANPEGDEGWLEIPPNKVEMDRDTPDGRSHVCYRRYSGFGSNAAVYCFQPGFGG